MKKVLLAFGVILFVAISGGYVYYLQRMDYSKNTIYINFGRSISSAQVDKLKVAFEHNEKNVVTASEKEFTGGYFNIYMATDAQHLPSVVDAKAINFLWIDKLTNQISPESLRPFDVIVVKNMPAFEHLKAINVRTAFIPDAINIADTESFVPSGKVMFFGDGEVYSLALSLAGPLDIKLDVYGKGFEGKWPVEDLKETTPKEADFRNHSLVLVDQSDEEIAQQTLNPIIINIIENGGLPYVRYNPAIEKLFGETVPMYYNGDEFHYKLEKLLNSPDEITQRHKEIKHLSSGWNSQSQAKKFLELFEIMDKKRI